MVVYLYTPVTVHSLCWTGTGLGVVYSAAIVVVYLYTPITVHSLCWTGTGLGVVYSAAIVAVNLSVHTYNRILPALDRYGSGPAALSRPCMV